MGKGNKCAVSGEKSVSVRVHPGLRYVQNVGASGTLGAVAIGVRAAQV